MELEEYFDVLGPNDIRLRGHRVGIESILYAYIHEARTSEEIAARFPTLTLDQVYATILYYLRNKERLDAYLADWIEHGNQMRAAQEANPTPAMLRLRQLRAAWDAKPGAQAPTNPA